MKKFGKKNQIDLNPLNYSIGLLGESGVGKSTIMKEVCQKLVGDEGYISLDVGKEDGHKAISGIITEKVEDWEKFTEIVDDIVENKETDYPNLKVVIIDTYDQLCELAEKEAIRQYNKTNPEKKALSINSAWGGFGRGLQKTIDLMLDALWELKKVGVSFIIIAHVKKADLLDVMTDEQYSILTSNTTQKYFNAIKQKLDFLGMAYIDREIVKEKTKKKDKNGNLIEKGKVTKESRVINFRDDTYSVDSKCRFANIVDKIPFDADEFIKAIQDAILEEQKKDGISLSSAKKQQEAKDKAEAEKAAEYSKLAKENKIDEDRNEELKSLIQESLTDEKMPAFKAKLAEYGIRNLKDVSEIPTANLEELYNTLAD